VSAFRSRKRRKTGPNFLEIRTESLSIAFAAAGKEVHSIDMNHHRVQLAKANAKIFGVEEKTDFVCADAMNALSGFKLKGQAVLLDPP